MSRRIRPIADRAVACGLLAALAGPSPLAARMLSTDPFVGGEIQGRIEAITISGTVVGERGAVAHAELTLLADDAGGRRVIAAATSDDAGRFAFHRLAPGSYEIGARRIGYVPLSARLGRLDHDTIVTLNLVVRPARLESMVVLDSAGVAARYGRLSHMHEFFDRRAKQVGRFFTREEIDSLHPSSIATLIRRVPGARIREEPGGELRVTFAQCVNTTILGPGGSTGIRGGVTALYIDGIETDRLYVPQALGHLRPTDIEGIEIYRSPSELPAEAVGNACAAIYIWTRMAGP